MSRSSEAIMFRYAERLKESYQDVQSNIMENNQRFIREIMQSERDFQKELITKIIENKRSILKDTTSQLMTGLKEIFTPTGPSRLPTASTPRVISSVSSTSKSFPTVFLNLQNAQTQPKKENNIYTKII